MCNIEISCNEGMKHLKNYQFETHIQTVREGKNPFNGQICK